MEPGAEMRVPLGIPAARLVRGHHPGERYAVFNAFGQGVVKERVVIHYV